MLDQDTIIVSPFGGESDICPRDESAAYYCYDFQGTNIQWSYENVYRISKALFPPDPHVLKAICFRGYKDSINFLKSRSILTIRFYVLIQQGTFLVGTEFFLLSFLLENKQYQVLFNFYNEIMKIRLYIV